MRPATEPFCIWQYRGNYAGADVAKLGSNDGRADPIGLSGNRYGALAGTDGAGDTLAADNLDAGLARVEVIDITPAVHFGQVSSVPGHGNVACSI